jgi:vacuolar-type H+-ATPase subunit D/Vma8
LQIFKLRVISAKKGYELLKKKCDALKKKFRDVLLNLVEVNALYADEEDFRRQVARRLYDDSQGTLGGW